MYNESTTTFEYPLKSALVLAQTRNNQLWEALYKYLGLL